MIIVNFTSCLNDCVFNAQSLNAILITYSLAIACLIKGQFSGVQSRTNSREITNNLTPPKTRPMRNEQTVLNYITIIKLHILFLF